MLSMRFRTLLLLLAYALTSCAQPAAPRAGVASNHGAASAAAQPHGLFLYQVRRGDQVSYLLGTIHLGFGFEEVLTPRARQAFESSRLIVTETDLADDSAARLRQAAVMPPDQLLSRMLDPISWNALIERLGAQLPAPILERMKPWLPSMLLGLTQLRQALEELRPGAGERMMDVELMKRARETQREQLHLETIDEQIAVFEQISLDEQLSDLRHALTDDSKLQARALVEAFASGDEGRLTSALFDAEQMSATPGFFQAVLFARNARWLPQLTPLLERGGAFVAVGAAHLLGERGLVRELRARGYDVERVL